MRRKKKKRQPENLFRIKIAIYLEFKAKDDNNCKYTHHLVRNGTMTGRVRSASVLLLLLLLLFDLTCYSFFVFSSIKIWQVANSIWLKWLVGTHYRHFLFVASSLKFAFQISKEKNRDIDGFVAATDMGKRECFDRNFLYAKFVIVCWFSSELNHIWECTFTMIVMMTIIIIVAAKKHTFS